MSVKKPQRAGFLVTQTRNNFLYVKSSTTWLYECQHHLSLQYVAEQSYDKVHVIHLDTVMFFDAITCQLLNMLSKYFVKTSHNMLLILTLTLIKNSTIC